MFRYISGGTADLCARLRSRLQRQNDVDLDELAALSASFLEPPQFSAVVLHDIAGGAPLLNAREVTLFTGPLERINVPRTDHCAYGHTVPWAAILREGRQSVLRGERNRQRHALLLGRLYDHLQRPLARTYITYFVMKCKEKWNERNRRSQ